MDWERRATHAEQENAELKAKLRDAERRLAPYEAPGARCPWCSRPTVFVGRSAAAHPACYARQLKAECREEELLRIIAAYRGDEVT